MSLRRRRLPLLLQPAWLENSCTIIIDETKLPWRIDYVRCHDYVQVAEAIRSMKTRGGGPMHASIAALVMTARNHREESGADILKWVESAATELKRTRPTNRQFRYVIERMVSKARNSRENNLDIVEAITSEADRIVDEYIEYKQKTALFAARLLKDGNTVLTHCNTSGTMPLIYKKARRMGKKVKVIVTETRPYLQGARLTTTELVLVGCPTSVIVDSAVAFMMREGLIDIVIVGSDVVTSRGYVANKIGTYQIAICARSHNVPFYVYAGRFDVQADSVDDKDIVIEQRSSDEILSVYGRRIAPEGVEALNPVFDVTPPEYITGIITPRGIYPPDKILEYVRRESENGEFGF